MAPTVSYFSSSPSCSPEFQKIKEVSEDVEAAPFATKKHGVNMGHYLYAIIDVKAEDGANPTVGVMFWSEAGAVFVNESTAISKTGAGANTGYQFVVPCYGRIILPVVTAGVAAGQKATISVAGYEMDHTL